MPHGRCISALLWVSLLTLLSSPVYALPGQTPDDAQRWMRSNATLRPAPGEKLMVKKSNTPAQRLIFRATAFPVGRATVTSGGIIRSEEISLYDMIHGINLGRLEESLRVIYGATVYQDYSQAERVYAYPDRATLNRAVNQQTPLLAALQGEVRQGERYAYWSEIARQPNGFPYTGRITVFLKEDLPKLQAELSRR